MGSLDGRLSWPDVSCLGPSRGPRELLLLRGVLWLVLGAHENNGQPPNRPPK